MQRRRQSVQAVAHRTAGARESGRLRRARRVARADGPTGIEDRVTISLGPFERGLLAWLAERMDLAALLDDDALGGC